jgi:serine/threonine protein kinase
VVSAISLDDLAEAVRRSVLAKSSTYEFTQQVSKGLNGYVFLGRNKLSGQDVAVKYYAGDPARGEHAEPQRLAEVQSDYIIDVFHAELVGDGWALFVTPLCGDGDLEALVSSPAGPRQALNLASCVLSGVADLHAHRFVHRDLKPANILLHHGRPLIADFGSVRRLPDGHHTVSASKHSLIYRPPESVATDEYSFSGDIYQVGVLLYQLFGGTLSYCELDWLTSRERTNYDAFTDPVNRTLFADECIKKRIKQGQVVDMKSLPPWISDRNRRIVRKATQPHPDKRYASCTEMLAQLHAARESAPDWIPSNNGEEVVRLQLAGRRIRVLECTDGFRVEQDCGSGYRVQNSLGRPTLAKTVAALEKKYGTG